MLTNLPFFLWCWYLPACCSVPSESESHAHSHFCQALPERAVAAGPQTSVPDILLCCTTVPDCGSGPRVVYPCTECPQANQHPEWEGRPLELGKGAAVQGRTSPWHGLYLLCSAQALPPCSYFHDMYQFPISTLICHHCPVRSFCHDSALCLDWQAGEYLIQSLAINGGKMAKALSPRVDEAH